MIAHKAHRHHQDFDDVRGEKGKLLTMGQFLAPPSSTRRSW